MADGRLYGGGNDRIESKATVVGTTTYQFSWAVAFHVGAGNDTVTGGAGPDIPVGGLGPT